MRKSDLFSAIRVEMKALGFKRRKSDYEYVIDLGRGVEGSCSFADSSHRRDPAIHLWIGTFVGLRWAAIEDRIERWCGDVVPGWEGQYVPTFSANLGYLSPRADWLEHRVELAEVAVEDGIRPVMSDVTDVALGFLRSHATYGGLIEALKTTKGQMPHHPLERLPLAFALAGDRKGAHQELAELKRLVNEQSFMSVRYLRFIDGFESEFPPE